jgi:hypothetical protein
VFNTLKTQHLWLSVYFLTKLPATLKAPASPPGPLVEPDYPRDLQRWEGRAMDQTHNRPVTPWDAQGACKPLTRPEGRIHAQTVPATDRDKGRESLGKNPPRTGRVPAEETTDLQVQDKHDPAQRQVGNGAPVGTMPRSRVVLTARARGRAPPAAEVNMPPAIHPAISPQAKAGKVW